MPLTLGLEACLDSPPPWLRGARLGILVNQASVDARFRYTHELLAARFPGQVRALLSPQHGLWSEQQDNMVESAHGHEPRLGVPIYSLYEQTRAPTPAMLAGLDWLVVDLQDVGTRVYTYIWTLCLCLRACQAAGVGVAVLDRPNPLGGLAVEGPRLQPAFASFVGLLPIPMRHALTIGELARWMNRAIGARLEVVPMRGWTRDQLWPATGRAWLPPSPNLPRFEGALVYPGQVLLEGTNLSEGRGTTTPFEVCGAPFVDGRALAEDLTQLRLPGVHFRPLRFEPTFHKGRGQSCGGVFVHAVDAVAFRPYQTTLALLAAVRRRAGNDFAWRMPPYEYEERLMPIDILTGGAEVRAALDAGIDPAEVEGLAAVDGPAWQREVRGVWLYEAG